MRRSHGPVRSSEPGNKRPVRLLRSRSDPACSGARLTGSQSATRSARGYSAAQHDGREAARRPKHRPLPAPIGDRPERQNHRDNAPLASFSLGNTVSAKSIPADKPGY